MNCHCIRVKDVQRLQNLDNRVSFDFCPLFLFLCHNRGTPWKLTARSATYATPKLPGCTGRNSISVVIVTAPTNRHSGKPVTHTFLCKAVEEFKQIYPFILHAMTPVNYGDQEFNISSVLVARRSKKQLLCCQMQICSDTSRGMRLITCSTYYWTSFLWPETHS